MQEGAQNQDQQDGYMTPELAPNGPPLIFGNQPGQDLPPIQPNNFVYHTPEHQQPNQNGQNFVQQGGFVTPEQAHQNAHDHSPVMANIGGGLFGGDYVPIVGLNFWGNDLQPPLPQVQPGNYVYQTPEHQQAVPNAQVHMVTPANQADNEAFFIHGAGGLFGHPQPLNFAQLLQQDNAYPHLVEEQEEELDEEQNEVIPLVDPADFVYHTPVQQTHGGNMHHFWQQQPVQQQQEEQQQHQVDPEDFGYQTP